jgi:hypothetical protein
MSLVYPANWIEPIRKDPLDIESDPNQWQDAKDRLNLYLTNQNRPMYVRRLVRVIRVWCRDNYQNMPTLRVILKLIYEVQSENAPGGG